VITRNDDARLLQHVTSGSVSSVHRALTLAVALGHEGVHPGSGSTDELWNTLTTIAALNLEAARVVEPHLDALAILAQAGVTADLDRTWGVFASEAPGTTLEATLADGVWTLNGVKQWCSLAQRLDSALVTASGRLWIVDLTSNGVHVIDGRWHARGLANIPSGPVEFVGVTAVPVGEPGWYLARPGFRWGGMGVAACWLGGAIGVARALFDAPRHDDFALAHLGAMDEQLAAARLVMKDAAAAVDAGDPATILEKRVRATVARTVDDVLERAAHALGPAPLALDADHAQRVADLALYVRQHHAERDLASLGRSLLETGTAPW
jgi:alkylation response protein AidB-like acyl-CoA dehydrogenase